GASHWGCNQMPSGRPRQFHGFMVPVSPPQWSQRRGGVGGTGGRLPLPPLGRRRRQSGMGPGSPLPSPTSETRETSETKSVSLGFLVRLPVGSSEAASETFEGASETTETFGPWDSSLVSLVSLVSLLSEGWGAGR